MRFRRRRRPKYTWLPPYGHYVGSTGETFTEVTLELDLSGTVTSQVVGGIVPCIRDFPQNWDQSFMDPAGPLALESGLSEQIANEYFLKRIVGKVNCALVTDIGNTAASSISNSNLPPFKVTAGFFVARVDLNNINGPAGTASELQELYSPQSFRAAREPWIWQRSWILGWREYLRPGLGFASAVNVDITGIGWSSGPITPVFGSIYPQSNCGYNSVADGPHIDAKTARRVRQEERLFFSIFAHPWPGGSTWSLATDQVMTMLIDLDCRYLGSLRKARNRSDFT